MDSNEESKKLIRKFLNPLIQGPNTEAIIEALSKGGGDLIHNVKAVHDNLYVVSASGRYLEQRFADKGLTKPAGLGLDDDTFRQLGLEVSNRKQVKDLINNILEIIYGNEYTRGQVAAEMVEPYQLSDGDTLTIQFDDNGSELIEFKSSQFVSISNASAQEVADAITKQLRQKGSEGFAFVKNDGLGNYVSVSSPSSGPSSSIKVLGGRAQNVLRFPKIRLTTGDFSTQWTIQTGASGVVRMTWTAGANPSLGKVVAGDYVNIYGSGFFPENQGTFVITKVKGGLVGNAYVEFSNPFAINQTQIQGTSEGVLFFEPTRRTILSNINYAAAFQTEQNVLEVFLPAITRVVRRERIGAAHVIENPPFTLNSDVDSYGPYVFDLTKPYKISKESTTTTSVTNFSSGNIMNVSNASEFPDQAGFICLNYGTDKEEGPIPYLGRPSNQSILLSPAYKFKNSHPANSDVSLVGITSAYSPDLIGRD